MPRTATDKLSSTKLMNTTLFFRDVLTKNLTILFSVCTLVTPSVFGSTTNALLVHIF